jgi:hypothetical protein
VFKRAHGHEILCGFVCLVEGFGGFIRCPDARAGQLCVVVRLVGKIRGHARVGAGAVGLRAVLEGIGDGATQGKLANRTMGPGFAALRRGKLRLEMAF